MNQILSFIWNVNPISLLFIEHIHMFGWFSQRFTSWVTTVPHKVGSMILSTTSSPIITHDTDIVDVTYHHPIAIYISISISISISIYIYIYSAKGWHLRCQNHNLSSVFAHRTSFRAKRLRFATPYLAAPPPKIDLIELDYRSFVRVFGRSFTPE